MATPDNFFKPNEKLLSNLSAFIKDYRKKNGLTQAQLAEKCGFHHKFIQTLETQKRNISISAFILVLLLVLLVLTVLLILILMLVFDRRRCCPGAHTYSY